MGIGMMTRLRAAVGGVVLIAGGSLAGGCGTSSTPDSGSTASTAAPSPATSPSPSGQASLIDAVRRRGTLRVLVTLAVPYTPEGQLSADAVRRQHAAIALAQQRLLDELAPMHPQVIAQYQRTPLLALTVNEAALRRLFASPLVTSIQEDTIQSTSE